MRAHEPGTDLGKFARMKQSMRDGERFGPSARELDVAAQSLMWGTVISLLAPETGNAKICACTLEQASDRTRIVAPWRIVQALAIVLEHRK